MSHQYLSISALVSILLIGSITIVRISTSESFQSIERMSGIPLSQNQKTLSASNLTNVVYPSDKAGDGIHNWSDTHKETFKQVDTSLYYLASELHQDGVVVFKRVWQLKNPTDLDIPSRIEQQGELFKWTYTHGDYDHRWGDKPAHIYSDGDYAFVIQGRSHRLGDKPARKDGNVISWWDNGRLDRQNDLPAKMDLKTGANEYYVDDRQLSLLPIEFLIRRMRITNESIDDLLHHEEQIVRESAQRIN